MSAPMAAHLARGEPPRRRGPKYSKYLVYEVRYSHPDKSSPQLVQYIKDSRGLTVSLSWVEKVRCGAKGGETIKAAGPYGEHYRKRYQRAQDRLRDLHRRARNLLREFINAESGIHIEAEPELVPAARRPRSRPQDSPKPLAASPDGGGSDAQNPVGDVAGQEVRQPPQHAPAKHPNPSGFLVDRPRGP